MSRDDNFTRGYGYLTRRVWAWAQNLPTGSTRTRPEVWWVRARVLAPARGLPVDIQNKIKSLFGPTKNRVQSKAQATKPN
jgi:hypothetical protein